MSTEVKPIGLRGPRVPCWLRREHCEPAMRRRSDSTSISRQWANQVFVARLAVAGAGLPIR